MQKTDLSPKEKQPNAIDVYVGRRIALRRRALKMTQRDLAEKMGLTFQQIQKYEKGYNRIGSSRLWDISNVLGVPVDFFFVGLDSQIEGLKDLTKNKITPAVNDPMLQEETLELVSSYYRIKNRAVAKDLLKLLQNLSNSRGKLV